MGDIFGLEDEEDKPKHRVHRVCVDDFSIGKYEVTQGLWYAVMSSNPAWFEKGGKYPVERVTWDDVQQFIQKLNSMTGKHYRLPTEAEWEYACRSGGKKEKYCGGGNINNLAWHEENSVDTTHPVGTKTPNGLGIYDMSGNVQEWCQDWFDEDYYPNSPEKNPAGPSIGENRSRRGGGYDYSVTLLRPTSRYQFRPTDRMDNLGFRLVLSPIGK